MDTTPPRSAPITYRCSLTPPPCRASTTIECTQCRGEDHTHLTPHSTTVATPSWRVAERQKHRCQENLHHSFPPPHPAARLTHPTTLTHSSRRPIHVPPLPHHGNALSLTPPTTCAPRHFTCAQYDTPPPPHRHTTKHTPPPPPPPNTLPLPVPLSPSPLLLRTVPTSNHMRRALIGSTTGTIVGIPMGC